MVLFASLFRGDNPLYDLSQNPAPEASYDNNGYSKNGYVKMNDEEVTLVI